MIYQLTERTWPSLILTGIIVDNYLITVTSTLGIKVKQKVVFSKIGLDALELEVKRVLSDTTIMVGPIGSNIKKISEAIPYDGGTLSIPEQSRNKLGDTPILRAVYDEEPTMALRTINVDPFGQYYTSDNPLPINIDQSILTAGTEDGLTTSTKFVTVNNIRLQILATHDREQDIEYADFGTKNQRVTKIDYTSPTFPGIVARREFNYTLVGNKYRRDSILWKLI